MEKKLSRKETVNIDILVTSRNEDRKSCNPSEYPVDLPRE